MNLLGDGSDNQKCVPFVSEYTDCSEENLCSGCTKCTCNAKSEWACEAVRQCPKDQDDEATQERDLEQAMLSIQEELREQEMEKNLDSKSSLVPQPESENLLLEFKEDDVRQQLFELMRIKRSVDDKSVGGEENTTISFYNAVDEINEDTLKNANTPGTLQAAKVVNIPQAFIRTSLLTNSSSNSLQIEHTPPIFSHASDNKVDTSVIHDDKEDLLVHHKIYEMAGNHSFETRDKDLSKLLVNEMNRGVETIGDKNARPISNITFSPENDTLTAVTFIAGNLLNKLWSMEKDATLDSLETEDMKHKKINDLLELFKEPLNLRQETFLKNALEQLSTAIKSKDVANISLCENVEKLKKMSVRRNNISDEIKPWERSTEKDNQKPTHKESTSEALNKITNILDLIQKYESVQNNLSDIKKIGSKTVESSINRPTSESLTKDEKTTLNVFGNILESLTKLLIPNKRSKKLVKGITNKNMLNNDKEFENMLKHLNIDPMAISAKDKIVLDYLTHIQNSPSCLLNKQSERLSPPGIEGNILLNLSEFYKIKSMSDLIKLIDSEKQVTRSEVSTTEAPEKYSTAAEITTQTIKKDNASTFEATKEKLKAHLKTILEDLVELQRVNGKSTQDIEIADALPCIYNLLNTNKGPSHSVRTKIQPKKKRAKAISAVPPSKKVAEIFDRLKNELKSSYQTRRTNVGRSGPKPKSAVVWERMIKNLGYKQTLQTRRHLEGNVPKTLEDMKKVIDKIENAGSNTYKTFAYLVEVPAAERLFLLKTLSVDTKKYITTLQELKKTIETVSKIRKEQYRSLEEFIDNVNTNINLNEKITQNLDKRKGDRFSTNKQVRFKKVRFSEPVEQMTVTPVVNDLKLTRDQILNQLIKNRILYYIRMKESTGDINSVNYDLAKKILLHLEIGNYSLGRELFKIFVQQNKRNSMSAFDEQVSESEAYTSNNHQRMETRLAHKQPLIQFEEPKMINRDAILPNQDQLIKQLLSIKKLNI